MIGLSRPMQLIDFWDAWGERQSTAARGKHFSSTPGDDLVDPILVITSNHLLLPLIVSSSTFGTIFVQEPWGHFLREKK